MISIAPCSADDTTAVVTFTIMSDRPVSVVGDFNSWDPHTHPLQGADGLLEAKVSVPAGRFAFRYLADGGEFFDDPDSPNESNGYGETHSVLEIETTGVRVDLTVAEPVVELVVDLVVDLVTTDDLGMIAGIGPKTKQALVAAGISSFAQVASCTVEQIKAALLASNIKSAPGATRWIEEAKRLASSASTGSRGSRMPTPAPFS